MQAYLVESSGEGALLAALEAIRTSALACEYVLPRAQGKLPKLDCDGAFIGVLFTSALLIDFNHAEDLNPRTGSEHKRMLRTVRPIPPLYLGRSHL